jgi:TRAP-type C4-dicarboxylate transport system substrate-binding protein
LTVAVNDRATYCDKPGLQSALTESAQEAGAYCTPLVNEQTTFTLERLPTEYGLPVIHPDRHAWRQSFDEAIRRICQDGLLSRAMYENIQSL